MRDTQAIGQRSSGQGISVRTSASGTAGALTLRSSLIEQNHSGGVVVAGCEGAVEATIVRDTMPDDVTSRGVGVKASDFAGVPAELGIFGSAVLRSHQLGVLAFGSETTIEATAVSDTQLDHHGTAGRGLCLVSSPLTFPPATFTLRSSIIEGSRCGCPVPADSCRVVSASLEAPPPVGGLE